MSTLQRAALAQLDTQAFALMSRLHVILRRESGRVTDIEYMRIDPAYCRHVLELAEQVSHEALPEICTRLQQIFFGGNGLFMVQESQPLLTPRAPAPVADPAATTTAATAAAVAPDSSTIEQATNAAQPYVGRLR